MLIVSVVSIAISFALGFVFSKPISTSLINTAYNAESTTQSTDDQGNIINKIPNISADDMKQMLSISVDSATIVRISLIEIAAVFISCLLMTVYITGINPKKILLE